MTFEEKESAVLMKQSIFVEQGGQCATCGKPLVMPFDLAHMIPKSKLNIRIYGADVIHHKMNMKGTCSNALCNDGQIISPATQPVKAKEHVRRIKEALIEENR